MAARSALHGRYAEAAIGGVLIVYLTEWEVSANNDVEDITAHGDSFKRFTSLDADWTFRAQGHVVPASAAHYINTYFVNNNFQGEFTLRGYSGTVAGGTLIFEGTGIPTRGTLAAPMGLASQEIEFRGTGAPTVGM